MVDFNLQYEDVRFKPGFRPLGTLDRYDKTIQVIKHQVVGAAWWTIVNTETA